MSQPRSLSISLHRTSLLAMASFFAVFSALGQTPSSPPDEQRDPSAPAGTDPNDQDMPTVTVHGKKEKKQAKKKVKLTAEQKKRAEIETSGLTALQWYDRAVTIYRAGKYLDARSILLPLEDSARALDIQEQVKLLIADTYFAQGGALNLAEALARYKSFSTFFPNSEHAEYVQFQIARSYFKQLAPANRDQSVTDSVVAEYTRFLDLHPASERAEQARKELAEARILRARSEFEVAKFYWEWKDYRGSATRLRTVLKERPELPEREQALYMCAQSLYNSGERAEGDSYAARLEQDYPGSSWKAKLDSGAAGGRTIEQQVQKQAKAEKQSVRTQSRQLRQDRKRTKQIRKDSGLPGNVPGDSEVARAATPATPVEATAPGSDAVAVAAPSRSPEREARSAEAEKRDRERIAKLEAEEAAKAAREAEQGKKQEEKRAADAKKAAEQAAKDEAKTAAMTDAQREELAAKEAKAAASEKERIDKLEAEEAKKAAAEAEQQKQREEKAAAEAAKKAAKKARKSK